MPFSRTEPNVPAFTEDANSPFEADSASSKQFTVAGDFDRFVLVPTLEERGFSELRLDGQSASEYNIRRADSTSTLSATEFDLGIQTALINRIVIMESRVGTRYEVAVETTSFGGDVMVAGSVANVSAPLDTFEVFDSSGGTASTRLRGFGLNLQ